MVYFETEAGLCNRLRGIAAAYFFAKDLGQPLTIIWKSDVNCNLHFNDTFSLDVDIPVKVINFDCMGKGVVNKFQHLINRLREGLIKQRCDIVEKFTSDDVDSEQLLSDAKGKSVYFKSCWYWYKGYSPFSIFKLNPTIAEKVDDIINEIGDHGVGVHIRRTDHRECIQKSPTEAFVHHMQQEPENTIFFVASDDASEKENLIKIFSEKRIKYNVNAELKRGTRQGMEDAVIDLYVLSRMSKILGSDGSSFTDTAAAIGNIPVIRCKLV